MENYLTVSALTKYIKAKLEGDKHLFSILIKGEISNFKRHSRGHLYFTLKDEGAQMSAIMFSRDASRIEFEPKEGDHVLITGRISVYEPSGTYSLQVSSMKLDGIGELYLKYEALKKDLLEKGYFSDEHKKPIPKFPKVIGVVTSPTGAVIEDIKNTMHRRYLLAELHLYPALVQGPGCAESIRNMILLANAKNEVDVLIVGRGGGSIEDLWGFNEMPVIQAIYDSKIPIITAIGHETDFTISDFVSDLRAPTPTAAAELATPNKADLFIKIEESMDQIEYKISQVLSDIKTKLLYLDQRLDRLSPDIKLENLKTDLKRYQLSLNQLMSYQLETKRHLVDEYKHQMRSPEERIKGLIDKRENLELRLERNIHDIFTRKGYKFDILKTALSALNPLMLMDKGFAVVTHDDQVITSVEQVKVDHEVSIRLKDGSLDAKIVHIKEKKDGKEII
ncbi:MAG: exodeoxyribonuclease VII large subunit [Firmicutes bacterium]|nr:exodeoxyribonuclease VII large subunit [Bacillota bacterium]